MKRLTLAMALTLGLFLVFQPSLSTASGGKKPVDVVLMTTPFGTNMYNVGAAYEQVFKKVGSWVHIKHQETPGAMYIYKYIIQNRKKMQTGEVPYTVMAGGVGNLDYLAKGRWPFEKLPWPTVRAIVSHEGLVGFYGSRDPAIKSLKDLAGKRVGTFQRARVFLGVLMDKPLFGKALGIYDKIKWAPLGAIGCKDAFLNGKLDAIRLSFGAKLEPNENGTYLVKAMAPSPPTMEVLSSGRKIYFLPVEKKWIQKAYDFSKNIIAFPGLIKKGTLKIINRDIWARAGSMCLTGDASLPDDIVKEIVRVRQQYRKQFARYHAALSFFPDTPYPIGSPRKYVHPATIKAMQELGYPMPRGQ